MSKEVISTNKAPGAVGPYSQAVRVGNLVFTAGQVAVVPATGKLLDGDIRAQTEQVMANLTAVLAAAGTSLEHAVKATVFLADINEFGAMNEVYGRYFTEKPPARSAFQVAHLPLGARIEIEMVAVIPN